MGYDDNDQHDAFERAINYARESARIFNQFNNIIDDNFADLADLIDIDNDHDDDGPRYNHPACGDFNPAAGIVIIDIVGPHDYDGIDGVAHPDNGEPFRGSDCDFWPAQHRTFRYDVCQRPHPNIRRIPPRFDGD